MKLNKFLASLVIFATSFNVTAYASEPMPDIKGASAITVDVDTKEIIYSKDIDTKIYPASTTKLVTGILLAENKKPTDLLTYSSKAKAIEPYALNFNVKPIKVGDKFTAENAMKAMLMCSANDVAYMISENLGESEENFSKMLNKEVSKLNLKNTHFVTATGLHDANHYSTSYDFSVIARELYKYPLILEAISLDKATLKTTLGTSLDIENKNKLLDENGCIGGKTGYTSEAGRCLVALYERNGRKLVGIVMKSIHDSADKTVFEDMEKIIDWSYAAKKDTIIKKDSVLKTETLKYNVIPFISYKKSIKVPLVIKENIDVFKDSEKTNTNIIFKNISPWKLSKDTSIGTVSVKGRDWTKQYALYPTVSKLDILKDNALFYSASIIIILLIIRFIRKRNKRKKDRRRKIQYY